MKHPLKGTHKITSPFGPRVHPISGKHSNHNGVDLISLGDQTIYAPEGGRITAARKSTAPGGGYGYYIKMVGDSGHEHILAHMKSKSFKVKEGDLVDQGDALGRIGATGNVTGPHCHWEVRVQGKFTDPLDHLTTDAPEKPSVAPVTAPKPPEVKTHTVVRGDTVWALSRKYGVTVKEIAEWSGLKNASVIQVGQKLTVKK
jgi:murein DD-endopeptidase MepM/ murein hydrolase activator NlpD